MDFPADPCMQICVISDFETVVDEYLSRYENADTKDLVCGTITSLISIPVCMSP